MVLSLLVLLGNTCFPAGLRLMVWAIRRPLPNIKWACRNPEQFCRARRLLLDDPRRCYTHLFPNAATQALLAVLLVLYLLQFGVFVATEVAVKHSPSMASYSFPDRLLAAHFTVVSSRTAGLSVLDMHNLSAASAFTLCVAMWISASPVVVTMRSTSTENRVAQENRHNFDLGESPPHHDGSQQRYEQPRKVKHQLLRFMSEHSGTLIALFCTILISESFRWDELDESRHQQRANFLLVLFEFCSAWGTVGLTMGRTQALSGEWHVPAKLALMVVMFLGSLRGLPDSIDPSVRLGMEYDLPVKSGSSLNTAAALDPEHGSQGCGNATSCLSSGSLAASTATSASFHSVLSDAALTTSLSASVMHQDVLPCGR